MSSYFEFIEKYHRSNDAEKIDEEIARDPFGEFHVQEFIGELSRAEDPMFWLDSKGVGENIGSNQHVAELLKHLCRKNDISYAMYNLIKDLALCAYNQ